MASQVLSGSSNPSYTNNTGQNVRVVINFMMNVEGMSWGGVSYSAGAREFVVGKGIVIYLTTKQLGSVTILKEGGTYPVDIALAPTETFSAICGPYNIVIVKEDGT